MTTDQTVKSYSIQVNILITGRNKYGDEINDGQLAYSTSVTGKSLSELGAMLQQLEGVIK